MELMSENPTEDGPSATKTAAQWLILVFWAGVMVVWAWWWSAQAGVAAADPGSVLHTMVLFVVALAPAGVALWKYPTGRAFRTVFALVAFSVPSYILSFILFA